MRNRRKSIKTVIPVLGFLIIWIFTAFFNNLNPVTAQEKPIINSPKFDADQPKFALLVGITNYKNKKLNKIDGCENNVPLLADTLVKDYGFSEKNVLTLMNEKAAKDEIIKNFQNHLVANAEKASEEKKEAVIVYYFCGHGSQYKDQDKDENDGKDETFVAYDSRTDDVFDMLDDELDDLKQDLKPFTTNTTLIFESCHSGTGSRGDREFISQEADEDTRVRKPYQRRHPVSTQTDESSYTEIAASVSYKSAKSESAEFCNCKQPQGLMTKALIEGLKRSTSTTTYRNLVREIANEVSTRSSQEPQVEGNRDAILFGGKAQRSSPYMEVAEILPKNQIIIKAGAIHGLKKDSQIAVYSSESLTNTGKEYWLMNGYVSKVGDFQSVVDLIPDKDKKIEDVKITSHIVLMSPSFGSGAVLVALNPNNKALETNETSLNGQIADLLKNDGLIENETVKMVDSEKIQLPEINKSNGIVRLRKGKIVLKKLNNKIESVVISPDENYSPSTQNIRQLPISLDFLEIQKPATYCDGAELKTRTEEERLPPNNSEIYYLDEGEAGGIPLFNKVISADDKELAKKLADLIHGYTYQTMLKRLDNNASTLQTKIKVNLQKVRNVEVVEKCEDGLLKKMPKDKVNADNFLPVKNSKIEVGSIFNFNLKNISGELAKKIDENAGGADFHISVLFLRSGGEIDVIYQSAENDKWGDDINKNIGGYIAKKPLGVEHLVVVVSRSYVDFNFYQTKGISRSPQSPLIKMLTQSGSKARNSGSISDEPDQWGIIHFDINITDK